MLLSHPALRFALALAALSLVFAKPLIDLIRLALNTDLYSHIPLIPLVSLYLAWIKRGDLPEPNVPNRRMAAVFTLAALALIAAFFLARTSLTAVDDYLALATLPYVLLIAAAALWFFGANIVRAQAFSIWFLLFLIPMPLFLQGWVNTFFQYTSAEVSYYMVKLANIPIFRPHPLTFHLPTIELHVAPSCSGIRSSLVLLITSIVAGEMFLRTKWRRWAIALFVIPLAIVRNGFRISTLSYLCTKVGPHMIDHWIHHGGGPIFFALSLLPFFLLLLWLWRSESRGMRAED